MIYIGIAIGVVVGLAIGVGVVLWFIADAVKGLRMW